MKAVFGTLLFGVLIKYITAIECYECADCSVPFDDDDSGVSKKECETSSCVKLNITHTGKFSIVSRGCGGSGVEEERCERKEVSGTYSEICYCNSDECNGSTELKLNSTFWMLTLAIISPVLIMQYAGA